MIVTALILDGLKALLSFIFMGWLVSIWAQLTFWFWFAYLGVSFSKPGKMQGVKIASVSVPAVLGVLPIVSALPAWSTGVVMNLSAVYAEDLLEALSPATLQVTAKVAKLASKKKGGATETGAPAGTGPKAKEGQPKKKEAGEKKEAEKKKEPEKAKMEEIKPAATARDLNHAEQNQFLGQLESTASKDKRQQELKQKEDRRQQLIQVLKDRNNPNIDQKRRLDLLKELDRLNGGLQKDNPKSAIDDKFVEPGYVEFERKTGEMEPVETER